MSEDFVSLEAEMQKSSTKKSSTFSVHKCACELALFDFSQIFFLKLRIADYDKNSACAFCSRPLFLHKGDRDSFSRVKQGAHRLGVRYEYALLDCNLQGLLDL